MRSQSRSSARPTSAWPRVVHHAWNASFCRSASSRVLAYGIFVSRLRASAWRLSGSLSRTLRMRWFQHRCSFASGNTAASAPQMAEMAVADHELRRVESASLEIPQDGRPALRRFAIAGLDGEEDLLPVPQRRQDDEDRGLLLLQPGFHVHAVHPEVDGLEVLERARLPKLVLGLPARLAARDRRRRQRGAVAEQPAQGEIEVALGQAMQVELGEKPPDFLGAPLECRQQAALKALAQPSHPRAPQRDRAVAEAKPPRLPEAVAVADRRVDRGTPLIPTTGEQLVDFRFQHLLQELLHAVPRERFERLPGW